MGLDTLCDELMVNQSSAHNGRDTKDVLIKIPMRVEVHPLSHLRMISKSNKERSSFCIPQDRTVQTGIKHISS